MDCVTGLIAVPVAALRYIDRTVVPIEPAWARSVLRGAMVPLRASTAGEISRATSRKKKEDPILS